MKRLILIALLLISTPVFAAQQNVQTFKDGVLIEEKVIEVPDPQETKESVILEVLEELLNESKSAKKEALTQKLEKFK